MPFESDLRWALSALRPSLQREWYEKCRNYYNGDHQMAFATENFKSKFGQVFKGFSENFCAGVVDALSDRLEITGFKSSLAETTIEDVEERTAVEIAGDMAGVQMPSRKRVVIDDPQGQIAEDIWARNNMDTKSTEVHTNALKYGDAFVIVWPDENMQSAIWVQETEQVRVQYDPNTPGKLLRATKVWLDQVEMKWYLNVYTQVGIIKYEYRQKASSSITFEKEGDWIQYDFIPNPYGVVPVFHFPNRLDLKYGISELKDVIALQDGLNKSDIDMLVAMEFASYKQRYIIGMDPEMDEETGQPTDPGVRNYGTDRMMSIPGSKDEVAVGQFDATDLSQFLRVQDKFWGSAARVSGTPLHYFFITSGDFPSGEAMKSAEARFIKRIKDRQGQFGAIWEQILLFAMRIEGSVPEDLEIEVLWQDASPRSESELADTAVKKKAVGVSRSQILKELGYDDETIQRMLEESDAFSMAQAALKMPNEQPGQEQGQNGAPPARSGTPGVRR